MARMISRLNVFVDWVRCHARQAPHSCMETAYRFQRRNTPAAFVGLLMSYHLKAANVEGRAHFSSDRRLGCTGEEPTTLVILSDLLTGISKSCRYPDDSE